MARRGVVAFVLALVGLVSCGGGTVYTVTATAGPGGTISPSSQRVAAGLTATFTVTPDEGCLASVTGCGGAREGNTYTTGPITGDCVVAATFSLVVPTPTVQDHGDLLWINWPTDDTIDRYDVYIAADASLTTDTAHELDQGQAFSDVTPPLQIPALENGTTYHVIVEAQRGQCRGVGETVSATLKVGRFVYVYLAQGDHPLKKAMGIYAIEPRERLPVLIQNQVLDDALASIARDPRSGWIYATLADENRLVVFAADPVTGALEEVQRVNTGPNPDRIALSPAAGMLVVSNRDGESLSLYRLNEDGRLVDDGRLQGLPHPPRAIGFGHDGSFLAVGFVGTDVALYAVDASALSLSTQDNHTLEGSFGDLKVHPYLPLVLVTASRTGNTVLTSLRVDTEAMRWEEVTTVDRNYQAPSSVVIFDSGHQAMFTLAGGGNTNNVVDLADDGGLVFRDPWLVSALIGLAGGPEPDRFYGSSSWNGIVVIVPSSEDPGYRYYEVEPGAGVLSHSRLGDTLAAPGAQRVEDRPVALYALLPHENRIERYPIASTDLTLLAPAGGATLASGAVDMALSPSGQLAVAGATWIRILPTDESEISGSGLSRTGFNDLRSIRISRSGDYAYAIDAGAQQLIQIRRRLPSNEVVERIDLPATPVSMDLDANDNLVLISLANGNLYVLSFDPASGELRAQKSHPAAELAVGPVEEVVALSSAMLFVVRDAADNMQTVVAGEYNRTITVTSSGEVFSPTPYDVYAGMKAHPVLPQNLMVGTVLAGTRSLRSMRVNATATTKHLSATSPHTSEYPRPGAIDRSGRLLITTNHARTALAVHRLSLPGSAIEEVLQTLPVDQQVAAVAIENRLF